MRGSVAKDTPSDKLPVNKDRHDKLINSKGSKGGKGK